MLVPKVTQNSRGQTMSLYIPNITRIERNEVIRTDKHAGGVDSLHLYEGIDNANQRWRWYQIHRTMIGHAPYTLQEYGWVRVTRRK